MIGLEKSIIGEDNRIGLFGVGYIYRKEHHKFENLSICALIDNDESKQGQVINGVRVITPYEAVHSLDYIIVTSNYFKEIKKQLIELGFEESHVIHYSESDFICYSLEDRSVAQKMYLSYQADSRHSVALVSNEMSFTGAPVVLLEVGKILVKNGFSVKAVTASKGSLSEAYRKCGIDVLYTD